MHSAVEICNLALSHIGETADLSSISPPDNTPKAEACAMFYPMARNSLFEMHDWNFATRRLQLKEVDNERTGWTHCYATPPDFIRAIKTYISPENFISDGLDYEIENNTNNLSVLYSNHAELMLQYSARVEEVEDYSPMFILTLSWYLASMISGTIIKGTDGMKVAEKCTEMAYAFLDKATASDSNQQQLRQHHIPQWIKAR